MNQKWVDAQTVLLVILDTDTNQISVFFGAKNQVMECFLKYFMTTPISEVKMSILVFLYSN